MPFGGLLTVGIMGLGGSLFSGLEGSSAASTAAQEQEKMAQEALDFQKQMWGQEQANMAPYLQMGSSSIGALMQALSGGKFGVGSIPNMPTFNGTFTAPTLAQAQETPGYKFTAQQGSKGILEGAAAAGGAISGGTLKALDAYNTGLANSTYNDVFNRALSTYGTGLSAYQANLGGYQANLQNQAQQYNQMLAPIQIGEAGAAGINNLGQSVAGNVGNLMTQIGNAQAAGTVGSANAWMNAVNGGIGSISQMALLKMLMGGGGGGGYGAAPSVNLGQMMDLGVTSPLASGIGPG
jgi:hypothetical protein